MNIEHILETSIEPQLFYQHEDARHFVGAPKTAVLEDRQVGVVRHFPLEENPINQIFLKAVGEAI